MGRPSIAEQRRIEIARALQNCIIRNGSYESTSIKDIAEEAGIAAGLVHHYFTNKDEIVILATQLAFLAVENNFEDLIHCRDKEERDELIRAITSDTKQSRYLNVTYSLCLTIPAVKEMVILQEQNMQRKIRLRLERRYPEAENNELTASSILLSIFSTLIHVSITNNTTAAMMSEILIHTFDTYFPIQ